MTVAYADRLRDTLSRVRETIAVAALAAGREPATVRLVAVTKGHPPAALEAALDAGLTDLGENRVEELAEKVAALGRAPRAAPGVRWHMSGSPLTISDGEWASEPNTITLHNDEAQWYRSWANDPARVTPLDDVLANATSYGFSFVGFGQEPRGKLSLSKFEIALP